MIYCLYIYEVPFLFCNFLISLSLYSNKIVFQFLYVLIMVSEKIESSMASANSSPSPQLSPTAYFSVTLPSALRPISIRLDRSNYTLRRSHIRPTVRAYELEGFLIGTQSQPRFINGSINSNYAHWCRLDQFLLS